MALLRRILLSGRIRPNSLPSMSQLPSTASRSSQKGAVNPYHKLFSSLSLKQLEEIAAKVKREKEKETPKTKEELQEKIGGE